MTQEYSSPRQDDQFRELFGVLRRRKVILAFFVLLFAALGVGSVLLTPASYRVTARVLLQDYYNGPTSPAISAIDRVSQVGVAPEIGAQLSLMQSPDILNEAFRRANASASRSDLSGAAVTITQENTTPVLAIEVNLPSADSASTIAQAIPEVFNERRIADTKAQTRQAAAALTAQVNAAKAALKQAENRYQQALGDQGDEPISAGGGEGAQRTQRVNSYDAQLASAKVELASAEAQLRESIDAQSKIPATISDVSIRPSVERRAAQEQKISDLQGQLNSLLVQYDDRNQEVRALRAQLAEARRFLAKIPVNTDTTGTVRNPERAGYDQKVSDARIRLKAAEVQVNKLTGLVASERAKLEDYQKRLPKQQELANDVDQKRASLQSISANLNAVEALAAKGVQPARLVSLSEPAQTQPVVGRTMIAATLLGLVLGVAAALLRDRFDNRIYTLEQIYDASGAVPIGQVPSSVKALGPNVAAQSRNRVLESYRSLRFNLETSSGENAAQSVLVSSAAAGEGRAGLSLNLATEAATDARRTILVDADLRTAELHGLLKLSRTPGLVEVLSGAIDLESALQPTSQPNLLFLASGEPHANPLELLSGPSFASVHEALKARADVIVFNSASLMRYTDARAMARVVDSVLFVAKRGFTRRDAMRYCVGMLRRAQARLLGVVLTDDANRTTDVPYFATE